MNYLFRFVVATLISLSPVVVFSQSDTVFTVDGIQYVGRIVEIRRDRDVSIILSNKDAYVIAWDKISRIGRGSQEKGEQSFDEGSRDILARQRFGDMEQPQWYVGGFVGLTGQMTSGTLGNVGSIQASYLFNVIPDIGFRIANNLYLSGTIGVQTGFSTIALGGDSFVSTNTTYSGAVNGWHVGLGTTFEANGLLILAHLVYREQRHTFEDEFNPNDPFIVRHSGYGFVSRFAYPIAPFVAATGFTGFSLYTGQPDAVAYNLEIGVGLSFSNITSLLYKANQ